MLFEDQTRNHKYLLEVESFAPAKYYRFTYVSEIINGQAKTTEGHFLQSLNVGCGVYFRS